MCIVHCALCIVHTHLPTCMCIVHTHLQYIYTYLCIPVTYIGVVAHQCTEECVQAAAWWATRRPPPASWHPPDNKFTEPKVPSYLQRSRQHVQ